MRKDRDLRAKENARYYVDTSRKDWSDDEFFASGFFDCGVEDVTLGAARDDADAVEIGFLEYSRVGLPLTILTLAVGWLVLILVPV